MKKKLFIIITVIPDFIEAKELNTYELELPDAGAVGQRSIYDSERSVSSDR